ncbi:MAG: hypothetical protein E2O84_07370 [Bacteroidetes bacterium]|nr:MAG: hypothetical protein E2O84_07370 [Bacteroidota bacterium]
MSLKSFHILFITVSVLLSVFVAVFAMSNMDGIERISWMGGSIVFGIGLVWYGSRFLKKMKAIEQV